MFDKSSAEIFKRLKDVHLQPLSTLPASVIQRDKDIGELIIKLEFSLNAVTDPLPNQGPMLAEHLQKLIAAIESEKSDENLTRSVSEAKAALGLYQVTL